MKKRNLKQTAFFLSESLNDADNSLYTQWYLMSLDIIDSKILLPPRLAKKRAPPKSICKISFNNKLLRQLILHLSIHSHDTLVKACLSNTSAHFGTPTLIYALMNPIGSIIFNFLTNLDVKAFFDNNSVLSCACTNSPFVNKDHNQIKTGN